MILKIDKLMCDYSVLLMNHMCNILFMQICVDAIVGVFGDLNIIMIFMKLNDYLV